MLVSYGGILPRPMSELRMIWFLLHGELELLHFCLESKLSVLDSVALVSSLHDVYHSLSESAPSLSLTMEGSGTEGFRDSLVAGMFVLSFLDIRSSDGLNPHISGVEQYVSVARYGSPSFLIRFLTVCTAHSASPLRIAWTACHMLELKLLRKFSIGFRGKLWSIA